MVATVVRLVFLLPLYRVRMIDFPRWMREAGPVVHGIIFELSAAAAAATLKDI